jgi:hypothetical protein
MGSFKTISVRIYAMDGALTPHRLSLGRFWLAMDPGLLDEIASHQSGSQIMILIIRYLTE